jgi:hypothetical protein
MTRMAETAASRQGGVTGGFGEPQAGSPAGGAGAAIAENKPERAKI